MITVGVKVFDGSSVGVIVKVGEGSASAVWVRATIAVSTACVIAKLGSGVGSSSPEPQADSSKATIRRIASMLIFLLFNI